MIMSKTRWLGGGAVGPGRNVSGSAWSSLRGGEVLAQAGAPDGVCRSNSGRACVCDPSVAGDSCRRLILSGGGVGRAGTRASAAGRLA